MSRHTRLSAAVTLEQRQREMSQTCDVPECTRPRAVHAHKPGGLVRMRRWCDKHRYAKNRPLSCRVSTRATPIPNAVKTYRCSVPECQHMAEVERAVCEINGVPTPGWQVRSYCRRHRSPGARPVGWLPPEREKLNGWRWHMMRFLGVKRWGDRGHFNGTVYRLQTGRLLHIVPEEAIADLREQQQRPWNARLTLGDFAARYNLAVVAVVGATLAIMEYEGNGKA